jgi:hypothetical protein
VYSSKRTNKQTKTRDKCMYILKERREKKKRERSL